MSHSPAESSNGRTSIPELTDTERHRLLAAERRRAVLDVLAERTPPVELEDLVEAIAAREDDATITAFEQERLVAISLHHNHLPMMTDVGAIDYDPATTRVESLRVSADDRFL